MTVELTRNRSTHQPQQSGSVSSTVDSRAQQNALAGVESRLADAQDIRKGIARGATLVGDASAPQSATPEQQAARTQLQRVVATSDSRAQDDFHESMNSLGRRAIREQLDTGRQFVANTGQLVATELPQMRRPERVPTREAEPEISRSISSERQVQQQPAVQPQTAAQAAVTHQPSSSGWVQSAAQETLDAGRGFGALLWDVGSWAFRKTGEGIVAGARLGQRIITDPVGVVKDTVEVAQNAGAAVVQGVTWTAGKIKDAFDWVVDNGAAVIQAARGVLGEVGTGIKEGFFAAGNTVLGLGKVLTGQMSWSQLSQQVSADFSKAWDHIAGAAGTVWSGIKAVGGFLGDLSNAIGLTDMAVGVYRLAKAGPEFAVDLARVALGQATLGEAFSRLGGNLSGAGQAMLGGLKCLGEVTGVIDFAMAAKHTFHGLAAYGRGEKQAATAHFTQAAVHGAFAAMSAGTIAATVATAGAAAPTMGAMVMGRTALKVGTKQVLNVAAKEFFEAGAKTLAKQAETRVAKEAMSLLSKDAGGKAVLAHLTKEAAQELGGKASKAKVSELVGQKAMNHLLDTTAVDAAHAGGKALHELMKKEGVQVLTKETAHAVHRDAMAQSLEELLKGVKFKEHISDVTLDLLNSVRDKNAKKAGAELAEALGVSVKEGTAMAKEARKALMKGRSDDAIKEELTEGITKHFKASFAEQMEGAHKGHFRKILNGELEESWAKELSEGVEKRAKEIGKGKNELVDDLVDAGWDGAKEGIEKTVRKVTREGIDDAFKRFRQIKLRGGLGDADAAPELRAPDGIKSDEIAKAVRATEAKVAEEARPSMGDLAATRQYMVTEGDEIVTVTLAFDNKDNAYHEVGRTHASIKRDRDSKATAA